MNYLQKIKYKKVTVCMYYTGYNKGEIIKHSSNSELLILDKKIIDVCFYTCYQVSISKYKMINAIKFFIIKLMYKLKII